MGENQKQELIDRIKSLEERVVTIEEQGRDTERFVRDYYHRRIRNLCIQYGLICVIMVGGLLFMGRLLTNDKAPLTCPPSLGPNTEFTALELVAFKRAGHEAVSFILVYTDKHPI